MKKIILVDNEEVYLDSLEQNLELRAPEFKVVAKIKDPAPAGDVAGGSLMNFLATNPTLFDDGPVLILLDIHYGGDRDEYRLGLKIARHIMSSEYKNQIKIIAVTGSDDQMLFDDLYEAGVINIIRKLNLTHSLVSALRSAVKDRSFLGDVTISPEREVDLRLQSEIAREIARGYRNKALERQGYDAVGVHKNNYRKINLDSLPVSGVLGHRLPGPSEWNDVWYLLHHLKNRDREIIDYVEKVCGIRIEVPA